MPLYIAVPVAITLVIGLLDHFGALVAAGVALFFAGPLAFLFITVLESVAKEPFTDKAKTLAAWTTVLVTFILFFIFPP